MPTVMPQTFPKRRWLFSVPPQPRHGGLFSTSLQSLAWIRHWKAVQRSVARPHKRPLPFRNFPPPPKRNARPLPPALVATRTYVESRFQAGHGYTVSGIALLCLVQQMRLNDVMHSREWRLELVAAKKGYPYYALYWTRHIVGLVDIPVQWGQMIQDCPALPRLQSQMAAYLVCCGFMRTNTTLVEGLAQTPVSASKRAIYRLFK